MQRGSQGAPIGPVPGDRCQVADGSAPKAQIRSMQAIQVRSRAACFGGFDRTAAGFELVRRDLEAAPHSVPHWSCQWGSKGSRIIDRKNEGKNAPSRFVDVPDSGKIPPSRCMDFGFQRICSKGHWCSNGVSTPCPAGTFQPADNMTRPLACIQTPLGTYATPGSANWTACAANTHVGATACHIRPLRDIVKPGIIEQSFYITHDFTRKYVNGSLLSVTDTANSTSGKLLQRIQNLTAAGNSLESAYTTAKLEELHNESVVAFDNTDLDYRNQTNLARFRIPYSANTYNITIGTVSWSIVHVNTNQELVGGTVNGSVLVGVPSSVSGMIGNLNYPIVDTVFVRT